MVWHKSPFENPAAVAQEQRLHVWQQFQNAGRRCQFVAVFTIISYGDSAISKEAEPSWAHFEHSMMQVD